MYMHAHTGYSVVACSDLFVVTGAVKDKVPVMSCKCVCMCVLNFDVSCVLAGLTEKKWRHSYISQGKVVNFS
jgi:hypothetical protein